MTALDGPPHRRPALSGALDAWRMTSRPFDDFRAQRESTTYAVECDLDYQASYIEAMVEALGAANGAWDFALRAGAERRDLGMFEVIVRRAETTEEHRAALLGYIIATRRLLDAILEHVPGGQVGRPPGGVPPAA